MSYDFKIGDRVKVDNELRLLADDPFSDVSLFGEYTKREKKEYLFLEENPDHIYTITDIFKFDEPTRTIGWKEPQTEGYHLDGFSIIVFGYCLIPV